MKKEKIKTNTMVPKKKITRDDATLTVYVIGVLLLFLALLAGIIFLGVYVGNSVANSALFLEFKEFQGVVKTLCIMIAGAIDLVLISKAIPLVMVWDD